MVYSAQKENSGWEKNKVIGNSWHYSRVRTSEFCQFWTNESNWSDSWFKRNYRKTSNLQKYKYRFLVENLLLSSNLENNTDAIFITCDGLWEGKDALIDSKIYKTLGVVCLSEIKNWNLIKGESRRSQTVFADSEYHTKSSHFGFAFITENVSDLLSRSQR